MPPGRIASLLLQRFAEERGHDVCMGIDLDHADHTER